MSCRDGSPSISTATSARAAASNTRAQLADTPGRAPYLRPRGWPRMWTPDVRLDPFDEPEPARIARVETVDLPMLLEEPVHRDAAGDGQPVGMIGDRTELVAAGDSCL